MVEYLHETKGDASTRPLPRIRCGGAETLLSLHVDRRRMRAFLQLEKSYQQRLGRHWLTVARVARPRQ